VSGRGEVDGGDDDFHFGPLKISFTDPVLARDFRAWMAAEDGRDAEFWRRLVTIWEAGDREDLAEAVGELVDEWQRARPERERCTHLNEGGACVKCGTAEENQILGPYGKHSTFDDPPDDER
jgi:hypothetical protein